MSILETLDSLLLEVAEGKRSAVDFVDGVADLVSDARLDQKNRIEYGIRKPGGIVVPMGKESMKAHMGYVQFSRSVQKDVPVMREIASPWVVIPNVSEL